VDNLYLVKVLVNIIKNLNVGCDFLVVVKHLPAIYVMMNNPIMRVCGQNV